LLIGVWPDVTIAGHVTRPASGLKSGEHGCRLERQMNGRLRPGSGATLSRLSANADRCGK
jgi:hypothetical protein